MKVQSSKTSVREQRLLDDNFCKKAKIKIVNNRAEQLKIEADLNVANTIAESVNSSSVVTPRDGAQIQPRYVNDVSFKNLVNSIDEADSMLDCRIP